MPAIVVPATAAGVIVAGSFPLRAARGLLYVWRPS